MNKVGQRLKTVRKILNKSQMQFADELNISKQAVSNIENSKSSPSISLLTKLLTDFNVNINYLLSGEGETFLSPEIKDASLKKTILQEVERFLENRGIT